MKKLKAVTDKNLAVYLVAKKFEIFKIEKNPDSNRCLFYFESTESFNRALLEYTTQNIFADYISAEKRITTLINMVKSDIVQS